MLVWQTSMKPELLTLRFNLKMEQNIIFKPGKLRKIERKWWSAILTEWQQVHKLYYKKSKNDKAWSYNERASISMLAAAIWQAGGIAIEEYISVKNRSGKNKNGRVDLWFKMGGFAAVVEAKQMRKSVMGFTKKSEMDEKNLRKINEMIGEAEINVGESIGSEPNGYAILFLNLYNSNEIEINLKNIYKQFQKSDCDFYACINCGPSNESFPAGFLLGKRYV
jgi:hypothetical protein